MKDALNEEIIKKWKFRIARAFHWKIKEITQIRQSFNNHVFLVIDDKDEQHLVKSRFSEPSKIKASKRNVWNRENYYAWTCENAGLVRQNLTNVDRNNAIFAYNYIDGERCVKTDDVEKIYLLWKQFQNVNLAHAKKKVPNFKKPYIVEKITFNIETLITQLENIIEHFKLEIATIEKESNDETDADGAKADKLAAKEDYVNNYVRAVELWKKYGSTFIRDAFKDAIWTFQHGDFNARNLVKMPDEKIALIDNEFNYRGLYGFDLVHYLHYQNKAIFLWWLDDKQTLQEIMTMRLSIVLSIYQVLYVNIRTKKIPDVNILFQALYQVNKKLKNYQDAYQDAFVSVTTLKQ